VDEKRVLVSYFKPEEILPLEFPPILRHRIRWIDHELKRVGVAMSPNESYEMISCAVYDCIADK
jgi:hypothetical protein